MNIPYECICCGYATIYKSSMFSHLYKKKRPCPKFINYIELTDDVKKQILDNHYYKIPNEEETNQS